VTDVCQPRAEAHVSPDCLWLLRLPWHPPFLSNALLRHRWSRQGVWQRERRIPQPQPQEQGRGRPLIAVAADAD
jgi:hypothetical protein